MSAKPPTTPEEWERFRFPPRPLPPQPTTADGEGNGEAEGEDTEGGQGQGGRHHEPELPPAPAWRYCSVSGFLKNPGLRKQIDLADLDDAHKIVRLLAVLEQRPDLSYLSLRRALQEAARERFGRSLEEVLSDSAGMTIAWKEPAPLARAAPRP